MTHVAVRPSRSPRRIALASTFPPKLCGLATFASALASGLASGGDVVDEVDVDDVGSPSQLSDPGIRIRRMADRLSAGDVAIVQHEYGIYGGPDGQEVLDLLTLIEVPIIVVVHTVPLAPSPNQRRVLDEVCRLADRVVVMTAPAADRLLAGYAVDRRKVLTIPHGATTSAPQASVSHRPPTLLTWGLLGPGKGIEHVIDAMALLTDLRPRIRYTVAGVTHPKVLARDGDVYRNGLIRQSWARGVASAVSFDDTYRDVKALAAFAASAQIVVLPYDSRDQVTSGVLVDAVAAGRPVIATAFPHAVDLLSGGAGLIVPHEDPAALARAVRSLVSDPARLAEMAFEASRLAPSLQWSAVAASYRSLCDELAAATTPVAM